MPPVLTRVRSHAPQTSKYTAPLLQRDRPWEGRFLNMFPQVWFDDTDVKYKLWCVEGERAQEGGAYGGGMGFARRFASLRPTRL